MKYEFKVTDNNDQEIRKPNKPNFPVAEFFVYLLNKHLLAMAFEVETRNKNPNLFSSVKSVYAFVLRHLYLDLITHP